MQSNIAYLGRFYQCVETIKKNFSLALVIAEKGKEDERIIEFCASNNIAYELAGSIEDLRRILRGINLDLLVVGSFGLILPFDIYARPRFKAINVHPGYLPFYRGRHPLPWALFNREKEAGIAVHLVEKQVDLGPIIERGKVLVDYSASYREIEAKVLSLIPDLLFKSIMRVFSQDNGFIRQSEKEGSYFPPMEKENLLRIIKAGVLNKELPAEPLINNEKGCH